MVSDAKAKKEKKEKKLKEKAAEKAAKKEAKALKKTLKKLKSKPEKPLEEEEKSARTAATEPLAAPKTESDSEDSDVGGSSSADEQPEPKVKCMAKKSGLPPRKALRCLIMKELDSSAPMIFENLIKFKELG